MYARSTVPCESIWLQLQNYHVLPLNPRLDGRIDIERAINRGMPAYPDLNRADFYDVELEDGWAYVHVCDHLKTVYLVAYFQFDSLQSIQNETARKINRKKVI